MGALDLSATDMSVLLTELAREHRVPGAQLAVHHEGRTVTAEYGVETHGGAAPVTAATAFPLGSLTKPFTATLAAMLADDGDVGFDDPMTGTLPELGPAAETLTLRRLLSHTSGLAASAEDEGDGDAADGTRSRLARRCRPAWAGIGPAFSYSNIGYALAGHLIEAVTGMTWWEAAEGLLLGPLGIVPSFTTGPRTPRRTAAGHSVHTAQGRVLPVADEPGDPVEAPDGALALSAADLVALARLHLADPELPALLGEDTLRRMREDELAGIPIGPYGMADGWGLGWAIHRRDGVDWFGHDGTAEGTSCHLRFEPGNGTVIALTTNANTGLALWRELVERLARQGIEAADHRPLANTGPTVPGRPEWAGTYANGQAAFEVVADGEGRLRLRSIGAITCYEGLEFAVGEPPGGRMAQAGRFLCDKGEIDLIQVTGRLARRLTREA
ncbi:serine hydrolase domain-containing protein [Microtetraspora malaysiensis]|uniref:Serine hydrolase domain-containing protein n=1 Tax=Microtetraspora malaysiensis TaxID=161358 RepID=A0ABW6T1Y3_9ACTN